MMIDLGKLRHLVEAARTRDWRWNEEYVTPEPYRVACFSREHADLLVYLGENVDDIVHCLRRLERAEETLAAVLRLQRDGYV